MTSTAWSRVILIKASACRIAWKPSLAVATCATTSPASSTASSVDAGLSYAPPAAAGVLKFDFGLGGARGEPARRRRQAVLNATLGVSLRARLSPTAEVAVDSQAIADLERIRNYRFLSDLSLTASLNSMWSARLAYGTRYANQPVPGFQRADHTVSRLARDPLCPAGARWPSLMEDVSGGLTTRPRSADLGV